MFDSVTCHESAPSAALTRCVCVRPRPSPGGLCADALFAFSVYPGHQRPAAAPSTFPSSTTCEYITAVFVTTAEYLKEDLHILTASSGIIHQNYIQNNKNVAKIKFDYFHIFDIMMKILCGNYRTVVFYFRMEPS